MLLGFAEYESQARALAAALGLPYARVDIHAFPDGESRVKLPADLPAHVVFSRSLDRPNAKLIELLLAAKTARSLGASRLTLVAPYLCYMRQDKAFEPGQAVSQRVIGDFLAAIFDAVVTVDPHLHRVRELREALPAGTSIALSAGPLMVDFLRPRNNPVLLGPDSESRQWVQGIAVESGLEFGVGRKTRLGDSEVRITLPDIGLQGREVVLIDDVVSSGETLAITAAQCLAAGAATVDVLVTHALFAEGAASRLRRAGVKNIWSSDSIPHASNRLHLADHLAGAIASMV